MCNGLRGHARLRRVISEDFESEYADAKRERERLEALLSDVTWYQFEVNCRSWKPPWPETWGSSRIELLGARIERVVRNGRAREVGHFPVYYTGAIKDAPQLPPAIVYHEWKDACAYEAKCLMNTTAADDWAPGGHLYLKLLKTTLVPTRVISKRPHSDGASA
jgi:hypothetical protein